MTSVTLPELSGYCIAEAHDDFEFVDGRRRDFHVKRGTAQVVIDGNMYHGTITISSAHGCQLAIDTPRGFIRVVACDVFPGLRDALHQEYAQRAVNPTLRTIFLDVDEVLADWVSALLRLLGRDPAEVHAQWSALSPRPWDVTEVLGVSGNAMWREIDEAGAGFWHDVEPFPWCHELFALCRSTAPTYLLTTPSLHPSSLAGKLAWMQQHFGRDFRDYLVGPAKHACARPDALLIDDSPKNCRVFTEHGGHALLFPGVDNDLHHIAPNERVGYVVEQLKGYRW